MCFFGSLGTLFKILHCPFFGRFVWNTDLSYLKATDIFDVYSHFGCRNLVYVSNKQNTPFEKNVPHETVTLNLLMILLRLQRMKPNIFRILKYLELSKKSLNFCVFDPIFLKGSQHTSISNAKDSFESFCFLI